MNSIETEKTKEDHAGKICRSDCHSCVAEIADVKTKVPISESESVRAVKPTKKARKMPVAKAIGFAAILNLAFSMLYNHLRLLIGESEVAFMCLYLGCSGHILKYEIRPHR